MKTTKTDKETYHEYLYKMMHIGSQADVEDEAIIQYVIDGIDDYESNKSILYGAATIKEIKKRLEMYEMMKFKSNTKRSQKTVTGSGASTSASSSTKPAVEAGRNGQKSTAGRKCYKCGIAGHELKDCKNEIKCFKCNKTGHIAPKCPEVVANASVNSVSDKVYAMHNDCDVKALVDTGSAVNVVSSSVYFKCGAPKLCSKSIKLTGFGGAQIETVGVFSSKLEIDGQEFTTPVHVFKDGVMQECMLIGNDLIKEAELSVKNGNIELKPRM